MLKDQGLLVAEANPSRDATSDAQNHFGPLSLYLSSGFSIVREQDDGLVVVRRPLSVAGPSKVDGSAMPLP